MQPFKQYVIHANPNFHMQIGLSQQSLSPSHHFLHSNAFSHLFQNPPFRHTPWMCSFCRLRYSRTFGVSSEGMHDRCGVLHALLCTFYYQESVETIKMDASGDSFSVGCIDLPLCFQQEAVRLCEGSVAGWER